MSKLTPEQEEDVSRIVKERLGTLEKEKGLLKDISKLKGENLKRARQFAETEAESLKVTANLAIATGDITGALESQSKLQLKIQEIVALGERAFSTKEGHEEKMLQILKEQNIELKNNAENREEILKKLAEKKDGSQEAFLIAEQELKKEDELYESAQNRLNTLKSQNDELDRQLAKYKHLSAGGKKVHKEAKGELQKIGKLTLGIVDYQKTSLGKWTSIGAEIFASSKATGGFAQAMWEVFHPANLVATAVAKVTESTVSAVFALDKASAGFAAATGTGTEYMGMIEDITRAGNDMGVTFDGAKDATKGLLDELIDFTYMTDKSKASLVQQSAEMKRLGIETKDVANLMNTWSKTMGSTSQEAIKLTKHLAMMGASVGIDSKKMIKNFQNANKTLAVYGKRSVGIFTGLAAAAKASGVEMSSLLGIAAKFDTFESAADSVGKLNALLGGNLSATQLLMQTEEQRVETIIQQIQVSGKSFADMDRFKQKAIANAVGITDMAEANNIFGMSMSKYRKYQDDMKASKLTQEKWKEAIDATIPIQEKFAQIMLEFAPKVTPLLVPFKNFLGDILDLLGWMNEESQGMFPWMVMIIGAVTGVALALWAAIKANAVATGIQSMATTKQMSQEVLLNKLRKTSTKQLGAMTKLQKANALTTAAQGQASAGAAKKMWALAGVIAAIGVAILGVGTGIWLAAEGLAALAEAMGNMEKNAGLFVGLTFGLIVALVGLGAALYFVAPAATVAAGPILAVGGAIALMGLGIGLAAGGLSLLVGSFKDLGTAGPIAGEAIFHLALGLGVMAIALWGMTAAMAGAAVSAWALAGPLLAVGAVAVMIGFGVKLAADSLGGMIEKLGAAAGPIAALGPAFAGLAGGLAALMLTVASPLGWLTLGKAMRTMGEALDIIVDGVNRIEGDKIKDLATFIDKVTESGGEFTILGKVAADLTAIKTTMEGDMKTTLGEVAKFSVDQTNKSIVNTKAQAQHDMTVDIKADLIQNLDIAVKIGDTTFTDAVKKVIGDKIKWDTVDRKLGQKIVSSTMTGP